MKGSRRQLFAAVAAALGLAPVGAWLGRWQLSSTDGKRRRFPVARSEMEWRGMLTPQQYRVLREHRTERAFSSPLDHEFRHGTFVCSACGHPLFSSVAKYGSGTGWPSFWTPLDGAVGTSIDYSFFMIRTEVHCARCGSHLGHVFPDGPTPTGLRYCMNGIAMTFVPDV